MRAKNLVDCYALFLDIDQGYRQWQFYGGAGSPQTCSVPPPSICLDNINILIFRVRPCACYVKGTMKR